MLIGHANYLIVRIAMLGVGHDEVSAWMSHGTYI